MEPLKRKRKKRMSGINVVPYVDVMLVLLVIFMITTPLFQENVKLELPRTSTQTEGARHIKKPVIVSVDQHGNVYMNWGADPLKKLSPDQLTEKARLFVKENPKTEVMIRGDRQAKYKYVVAALATLQTAGVQKVELVTIFENKGK